MLQICQCLARLSVNIIDVNNIKYYMEKLHASKINRIKKSDRVDARKKSNNKHLNKQEKNNKLKNSMFIQILLKNKFSTIAIVLSFMLSFLLCILFLNNNAYYIFLMRPKILENSSVLIILICLFLILLLLTYFINVILFCKEQSLNNNTSRNETNITKNLETKTEIKTAIENDIKDKKLDIKQSKTHLLFNNPQKVVLTRNLSKTAKNGLKIINFKQILSIFLLFLLLFIGFELKFLWLCVVICFAIFFKLFVLLLKEKGIFKKLIYFILLLNEFCILCSFYFIYLLN